MTLRPVGVASADVKLGDFAVTGGENGWYYQQDFLSTIKPNGCNDKKYGFVSLYWEGEAEEPGLSGWYDFAECQTETFGEKRDNVKIPFGTGIVIYTSKANVAVTFAGEVLSDDYGIPLSGQANTFTGVICPVNITLGMLEPTGGENGWYYQQDFLSTIKPNGCNDKKYGYVSLYWEGEAEEPGLSGWYDFTECQQEMFGEKKDSVPLDAGQAFVVYTSKANVELVVPSAIP